MRRYGPSEVARAIGCHLRTVQRALIKGQLKGTKVGRGHYWSVSEPDLLEWLKTRRG